MNYNYTQLLKTASRLIQRFGAAFSYTQVITGSYDPSTRAQSESSNTVDVYGVFIGPGKTFLDGTLVQTGEGRFLLDAKGLSIVPLATVNAPSARLVTRNSPLFSEL